MKPYQVLAGVLLLAVSCDLDRDKGAAELAVPVTGAMPSLDLPPHAWLMFESVSAGGPDRSGNWRFFLAQDGCYYVAGNRTLLVDASHRNSTESALFWNTGWPEEPTYCLEQAERSALDAAIDGLALFSLSTAVGRPASVRVNDGSIERWTLVKAGAHQSIVIEDRKFARDQPESGRDSDWVRQSLRVDALDRLLNDAATAAMKRRAATSPKHTAE
jgi:hypothetical protein